MLAPSKSTVASTSVGLRVFVLSAIFYVAFWVYGSTYFLRDPGSVFYDVNRAFDRDYSAIRDHEVQALLDSPVLGTGSLQHTISYAKGYTNGTNEDCLCAVVTTVHRGTSQPYVYTTISSMLTNLTLAERSALELHLLFADFVPEDHRAFANARFLDLVDEVHTYKSLGKTSEEQETMKGYLKHGRMQDKSTEDYASALGICAKKSKCRHVAVIEDDVLFANSWFARTMSSLASLPDSVSSLHGDEKAWLDLRLFNQERSTGWSSRKVGDHHEVKICLSAALILAILTPLMWTFFPRSRQIVTPGALAIICVFTIPVGVVLFYQSGKASLLPPASGVWSEFYGCCTQAQIYNRWHVDHLIDHLKKSVGGDAQYDMAARNFAFDNGLQSLAQYPVMVQHIGRQSALKAADSSLVWSMAYERLGRESLARAHAALVKGFWGEGTVMKPFYDIS